MLEQIEAHLEKCGDWIAGGNEPTAADYMMVFSIEAWGNTDKTLLGPKTRAYVNRAHARYAPRHVQHLHASLTRRLRPAYKRVGLRMKTAAIETPS